MMLPMAFVFEPFLLFLVWGVLLLFNLWLWQKTKGQGNLVMMVGAGVLALAALLFAFESVSRFVWFWLPFIGAVILVIGFYLTSKTIVDAHLTGLKTKLHDITAEKKAPPSSGPTPPPAGG